MGSSYRNVIIRTLEYYATEKKLGSADEIII